MDGKAYDREWNDHVQFVFFEHFDALIEFILEYGKLPEMNKSSLSWYWSPFLYAEHFQNWATHLENRKHGVTKQREAKKALPNASMR